MATVRLHVLGTLSVDDGDKPIHIKRRKAQALLVYLALKGGVQRRDALAALLWPEADASRARAELRRAIYTLRKHLGPTLVITDTETVAVQNDAASLWADALHFRDLLSHTDVEALYAAVDLYRGELLAGFTLADAPDFEEWRYFEAESLLRAQVSALEQLARWHAEQGQYGEAVGYARRRVAMDPLHEPAHRELMRFYAWSGQQGSALRQYEQCRALLERELGVSLDEETVRLLERIRSGDFVSEKAPQALTEKRHKLPAPATAFVGRAAELAHMDRRLANPDCRLLTIVGPGGIGKTRLAIRAAQEQVDRYADAVCYVDLAPVESADLLAVTILRALGAPDYGAAGPERRLYDLLCGKEMLLVLDNFEHLMAGADLLPEMLRSAPGIKLLVTSRERLNLLEEWLEPLEGLDLPPDGDISAVGSVQAGPERTPELGAYDATNLFVQCMRRLRPQYAATGEEAAAVVGICRLLEGMPLGIELAASWTRTLSPAEVQREMARSLEFLSTSLRDMPARHCSMHAVFDHSWRMLSERERGNLRQMSVFRGGCTREGAEAVAGTSLTDLSRLVDKSWLRRQATGRYGMHELMRQYCEVKLEAEHERESGETPAEVRRRHCSFIGGSMRAALQKMNFEAAAYDEIIPELGNLQSAWRYAVETLDSEAGQKLALAIWFVGDVLGWFTFAIQTLEIGAIALEERIPLSGQDGEAVQRAAPLLVWIRLGQNDQNCKLGELGAARDSLEKLASAIERLEPGEARLFWQAQLRNRYAWQAFLEGEFAVACHLAEQTLNLFEDPRMVDQFYGTPAGLTLWRADVRHHLAQPSLYLGDYEKAKQLYERSVGLSGQIGEGRWKGQHLSEFSQLELITGDLGRAEELAREGLRLIQSFSDRVGVARLHVAIGRVAMATGREAEARTHFLESLGISKQCGSLWYCMQSLNALGRLALLQGSIPEARKRFEESLAVFERTGTAHCNAVPGARLGLGWTALAAGNLTEAIDQFRKALATGKCAAWEKMETIAGLAEVAAREGHCEDAVELLALVVEHPFTAHAQREQARERLYELEKELQPDVYAERVNVGRDHPLEEALSELVTGVQEATGGL